MSLSDVLSNLLVPKKHRGSFSCLMPYITPDSPWIASSKQPRSTRRRLVTEVAEDAGNAVSLDSTGLTKEEIEDSSTYLCFECCGYDYLETRTRGRLERSHEVMVSK